MTRTEINKLRRDITGAMHAQGYSARRLSNESNVGYLTLRRFLNGSHDTTTDRLMRILDTLGLEVTNKEAIK
tara:strand:- start:501 stop:716 length:216 start_codon:yes stop_codon:yes gene_type:complete